MNRANHFAGIQRVQEHRCGAKNLREENSEKLAEDVAQRQEIEKAQRMKDAFVAAVAREFFFDRSKIREKIAVREDDAARLRRGAGREDDFDWVGAPDRGRRRNCRADGG